MKNRFRFQFRDWMLPVAAVALFLILALLPLTAHAAEKQALPLVAAGDDHAVVITKNEDTSENMALVWGSNLDLQLGTRSYFEVISPSLLSGRYTPAAAAAGSRFTLVLSQEGDVYGYGDNSRWQCGQRECNDVEEPILSNVVSIAAGSAHGIALTETGDVYTWGAGTSGQLGDGKKADSAEPVKVLSGCISVEAGGNCSFAIRKNGDLYAWGYGKYGALGRGNTASVLKPTRILRSVASVDSSGRHTLIVKKNGDLYACGKNDFGQLGNGKRTDSLKPVRVMQKVESASAGWYGSLILKTNGDLYGCGQIGLKKYYESQCSGLAPVSGDKELDLGYALPKPVKLLSDAVDIAMGDYFGLVVKKSGEVLSFGDNSCGQLGAGDYKFHDGFVEVPLADHTPECGMDAWFGGRLGQLAAATKLSTSYSKKPHEAYRVKFWDGTTATVLWFETKEDRAWALEQGELSFAHTEELLMNILTGESSGYGREYLLDPSSTGSGEEIKDILEYGDAWGFISLDEAMPASVHRIDKLVEVYNWEKPW